MKQIVDTLKEIVGNAWVRSDPLTRYYYATDVMTHFGQGEIYPENRPLAIVFPGSTDQVRAVVDLARKNTMPIYPVGGGTVMLVGSITGKPDTGITFDFHRMQNIEVDRERMVTRVQPGVTGLQVSQVIRDMDLGYRPYFGGSPGSSLFVPYQIFTGINKMAGYQDGMGINCACGMEMVLSSGEVVKTGSMIHPKSPAWPHGPGPALTYLPFFANGGFGIVTEMEFRFFPTPQEVASLWVTFPSLKTAIKAMYEVMVREYACGATVMGPGCWTHALYSSRHWQEGTHFVKGTQDINLVGMSFRGSARKVAFERKACVRILKEYGGVVMPEWIVAILDGHEENAAGWQQCNSTKICGTFTGRSDSGGIFMSSGVFDSLDRLEEYMDQGMKIYQRVCRENPMFLNYPHPTLRLYASCGQTYLSMGGHSNTAGEVIFMLDFASTKYLPVVRAINSQLYERAVEGGMAPLGVGRDRRMWTECQAHFSMARIVKKVMDQSDICAPGVAFPLSG